MKLSERVEYLRNRIVDAYETRAYTDLVPSGYGGYKPNEGWEDWENELKEIGQLINKQPQLSDDVKLEIIMMDNIVSIVEKSRINKMAKYVIYDYINNHIKSKLQAQAIEIDRLKEEIKQKLED